MKIHKALQNCGVEKKEVPDSLKSRYNLSRVYLNVRVKCIAQKSLIIKLSM